MSNPITAIPASQNARPPAKAPWVAPKVTQLPRLTDLTLQTSAIPGDCGTSGGSTCF